MIKVSDNNDIDPDALQQEGIGTAENMSLQTAAKNMHGWCRHDVIDVTDVVDRSRQQQQ